MIGMEGIHMYVYPVPHWEVLQFEEDEGEGGAREMGRTFHY